MTKNGYYKTEHTQIGVEAIDREIKDADGNLLYTEHIKEPILEEKEVWVEYTPQEASQARLAELKELLAASDYKTDKMLPAIIRKLVNADLLTEDTDITEYLALDDSKQVLRDSINSLDNDDIIL